MLGTAVDRPIGTIEKETAIACASLSAASQHQVAQLQARRNALELNSASTNRGAMDVLENQISQVQRECSKDIATVQARAQELTHERQKSETDKRNRRKERRTAPAKAAASAPAAPTAPPTEMHKHVVATCS